METTYLPSPKIKTPRGYKKWLIILVILPAFLFILKACKDDKDDDPDDPAHQTTPYTVKVPYYFPTMKIPSGNPLTVEGIRLGRHLYYDVNLSKNGPLQGKACASCHHQENSFTINNGGTAVMAHVNLAWSSKFLWFGGVEGTLEDIMHFELEDFFMVDLNVLRANPKYATLYKNAFGSSDITMDRTARAMAQFFRTLTSTDSKYDRFLKYGFPLSASEERGYQLFFTEKGDCFHCHANYLFMDDDFHNIGLDSVFTGSDRGRNNVTGSPFDMGKFKTPTLRNIELTSPYMHDGRFATLQDVVSFYNSGVKNSETLDPIMTKPGKENGLNLTPQEIADLVAFLHTLTDTAYVNNPELSNPW